MRDGLTIVVSPLIALMKDQVDGLQASGIAATYLNSTLDGKKQRHACADCIAATIRLLYVAPERLMLDRFLERALNWNIAQIRDRRSALHQRMGPRFPAGISRAEETAGAFARRTDHGADRDRDRARARRYRQSN